MQLSIVVVVYNEEIGNVASLPTLLKARDSRLITQIIVVDNSTMPNTNSEYCSELRFDYIDMGGNAGLSKAYNTAIRSATGDYICILDDDSILPDEYFDTLNSLNDGSWDMALPFVTANTTILSPSKKKGFIHTPFQSIEEIEGCDSLSGINSGMIVRASVYEQVKYDESLFLDLIDHKFCEDVSARGFRVVFLKSLHVEQQYSLTNDDKESSKKRFVIFKRDARRYYSYHGLLSRIYCEAKLLKRRIRIALR